MAFWQPIGPHCARCTKGLLAIEPDVSKHPEKAAEIRNNRSLRGEFILITEIQDGEKEKHFQSQIVRLVTTQGLEVAQKVDILSIDKFKSTEELHYDPQDVTGGGAAGKVQTYKNVNRQWEQGVFVAPDTCPKSLNPIRAKVFSVTETQFLKLSLEPKDILHETQGVKTFSYVQNATAHKQEQYSPLLAPGKLSSVLTYEEWIKLCAQHSKKLEDKDRARLDAIQALGMGGESGASGVTSGSISVGLGVDDDMLDLPPELIARGRGTQRTGGGTAPQSRAVTPNRMVATPQGTRRPSSAGPSTRVKSDNSAAADSQSSAGVAADSPQEQEQRTSRARKNGKVDIEEYKLNTDEISVSGLDDRVMKPVNGSAFCHT